MRILPILLLLAATSPALAMGSGDRGGAAAPAAPIDRFSDEAGHLFKRSAMPGLPGPNAPIDFDQGPFITRGFGPAGDYVSYYNFDVQPRTPAPIYVLFKKGAPSPVDGQLNLVDVIPGDAGYNDFWNVVKVTVPDDYVANEIRSVADLKAAGYPTEATTTVVNCPLVPEGSTARLRYAGGTDTGLHRGWYHGMVVSYFNFSEKALTLNAGGQVPVSPIFVTFNKNPDSHDMSSGPASGFVTDPVTGRVHNVVATIPEDAGYSPLWSVDVYDNKAFAAVKDLATAEAAPLLAAGVAKVNCPVVARTVALDFSALTCPIPETVLAEVQTTLTFPSGPAVFKEKAIAFCFHSEVDHRDLLSLIVSAEIAGQHIDGNIFLGDGKGLKNIVPSKRGDKVVLQYQVDGPEASPDGTVHDEVQTYVLDPADDSRGVCDPATGCQIPPQG